MGRANTKELVEEGLLSQKAIRDDLTHAIVERENKRKEDDFKKFIRSIKFEVRLCEEIIEKPPAGEDYKLVIYSLFGTKYLVLYGGLGYKMFTEVWTIKLPSKTHFGIKWEPNKITYDIFASDRVSMYQSTFTIFNHGTQAMIVGGSINLGAVSSFDNYNNDVFNVDLQTLKSRAVRTNNEQTGPGFRKLYTADFIDGCLYIFGGLDSKEDPQSSMWKLKLSRQPLIQLITWWCGLNTLLRFKIETD